MAKLTFNAAAAEPMEERTFTLIPEGEYLFQIVKSEIVPNKKSKKENDNRFGERLNMQAKILKGKNKGSIVFIGLNWNHPNVDAQNISDREFKSICDAVGVGQQQLEDTEELHADSFIGTVVHSAPSGEYKENGETKFKYGPKAEIKKYEKMTEDHRIFDEKDEIQDSKESGESSSASKPPWGAKKEAE